MSVFFINIANDGHKFFRADCFLCHSNYYYTLQFVCLRKSISDVWQIEINKMHLREIILPNNKETTFWSRNLIIYILHMITEIETGMLNVLQTWRQLQVVLKEKSDIERTQHEIETEVNTLATRLKESFESNNTLISSLQMPTYDPEETQEEHRKAVLDHKWAVSELMVWGQQLDNKIQTLLRDDDNEFSQR